MAGRASDEAANSSGVKARSPPGAGHRDGAGVVVDPHAPGGQTGEVATEPAADVERATQAEAAQIPPVGALDVEHLLPPRRLEPGQALRVGGVLRACGLLLVEPPDDPHAYHPWTSATTWTWPRLL